MSQSQNEPTKLADVLGAPEVVEQGRLILELVAISGGPYWLLYASKSVAMKVGFGLRCAVRQIVIEELADYLRSRGDAERN
jgi:hypothetical protein